MNRLLENFRGTALRKSLVLLASFLLLAAFLLIFVFSGVLRDRAVQELAHENAGGISRLVFQSLYSMMRGGFNRQEIDEAVAHLSSAVPDLKIKVYRGASVAQQFGEMSGEAAIIQSDAALSQALASGQEAMLFPDKRNIRHLYPIKAEAECLVCHTQSHVGAVQGVVDITYPIQTLKASFSDVTSTLIAYTLLVLGLVFAALVAYLKQRETQRRLQIQEEASKALEQAYDTLRASEERFRQINASAQDAIVIVNEQGRITDWNLAAQRIFQYSQEEAVGQQVHQLIVPPRYHADAARVLARFNEAGEGPLIGKTTEVAALRKDGGEFPVELSISAVKLKGRWHAIGIIHDITERKLAEKTLSESNVRFRNLVETTSDWIWEVDENTVYTYASHKIQSILGYEAAEIIGKTPFDLMPPEEAKRVADIFDPIKAARKSFANLENTNLHKDGHPVVLETSGVPVIDADGKFRGYHGIDRDLTERIQIEKERLEAGARTRDALKDAIGAIAATLEQRDPYTAGHQRRVAQLAVAIGEEMGLGAEALEGVHFGGLIHDIGKISVPAQILGKPGRITDIELGLIKIHAEAGYQIVKGIAFPWPVANMVRQHHERLDGSGYPQGLKGDQIILEARILAVADVVEAMLANRPYRPGLGMDTALGEIARGRGTQLDPVAVDACLRVIKEKGFAFPK